MTILIYFILLKMFYQHNYDAVFYTGISSAFKKDTFENSKSDIIKIDNFFNNDNNENKVETNDDKNLLNCDDKKNINTELSDTKPVEDKEKLQAVIVQFCTDVEWKKRFRKITFSPVVPYSHQDMPCSIDPRKIRQCMKACFVLLLKILPKFDDTVDCDNYYSFLKSPAKVIIKNAKEKFYLCEDNILTDNFLINDSALNHDGLVR